MYRNAPAFALLIGTLTFLSGKQAHGAVASQGFGSTALDSLLDPMADSVYYS